MLHSEKNISAICPHFSGTRVPMVLYQYGFNGKEKESELYGNGNALDFGERVYDPRIGRWFSLDKINNPSLSQYSALNNSPIYVIDKNGKTGEAYIDGDNVVIESHFNFYGNITKTEANEIASNIQASWNSANGKVTIDGREYNVIFKVSASVIENKSELDDEQYLQRVFNTAVSNDPTGSNYKDNYVRIETNNQVQRENEGFEVSQTPGEAGFWLRDEILSGKTEEHEFGEGLGLDHPTSNFYSNGSLRIMVPRGLFDCNPDCRTPTQADIDDLNLSGLLTGKGQNERVGVGTKAYQYFYKNGASTYNATKLGEEQKKSE